MKLSTIIKSISILLITGNISLAQTPVRIDIDITKGQKPVSPLIYGKNNVLPSAFLNSGTNAEITLANEAGVRFVRQGGGNNSTKYNWRRKLSSHPDWYNNVYANDWDAAAKNMFAKMPGVHGMWSFQLLGMAAANTKNNFNDGAYNQSQWWSGVGQNLAGGGQINPAGGGKALVDGNPALYLEAWTADSTVGILDKWFGDKGLGYDKNMIKYWNMDNEPEIWSGTHDDVMKTQCSAEEYMQLYFKVAKAARAKYPDIKLVGPVPANEWQWYRWGSDGISYKGGKYCWLEYFILRIAEEEKATGIRLLDVLDIHFYPGETNNTDCVQLHRVYFDRTYVYPGANGVKTVTGGWDGTINKEYIFGRCSDWLTKYMGANNGVTFGVTEIDIKPTDANVLAVWYASTMGEFMKQGVEIFTPWSWKVGMWETLHLFSRYNLGTYVQAVSQNETLVSAYPTMNVNKDSMTIVLVNRSLTAKTNVNLNFTGFTAGKQTFTMYSISKLGATETFVSHSKNALIKSTVLAGNLVNIELAPLSVNSITLKAALTSAETELKNNSFNVNIYPNPSTNLVQIHFITSQKSPVNIKLFNTNGQFLKTIRNEMFDAGSHQIELNTSSLSGGIYWIKFETAKDTQTVKMIKNQ